MLDHYVSLTEFPPDFPEEEILLLFPVQVSLAGLVESTLKGGRWTGFTRLELTRKTELLPLNDPRHSELFTVGSASLGGIVDFVQGGSVRLGIGGSGSLSWVPSPLVATYGESRLFSLTGFVRLVL